MMKTPLSWRRLFGLAHLWVGLAVCIPAAVIGLTGSILVFDEELRERFEPSPKRVSKGTALRSLDEIVARALDAAPAGMRPVQLSLPATADSAAELRFASPDRRGPAATVFVDPETLEILGRRDTGDRFDLMREIHRLHGNLSIRDRVGRQAVGWFGVGMVVLGISGLVLWWPRRGRWAAAFGVRRNARGYGLHRQLHGAVGIWGLVVFMVVSLSGVYLSFPRTVGSAVQSVAPGRDIRASMAALRVEPVESARPVSLDKAVALARANPAVGDVPLRFVTFPRQDDQPLRLRFSHGTDGHPAPGHGPPLLTVFVDQWRSRVIAVFDPRTFGTGEALLAWQHAIHGGTGLGWIWKGLVFLSGLLPVLFAITGFSMWWIKRRNRRAAAARAAASPDASISVGE